MATKFPVVDALLDTPKDGVGGSIAICTNATATGQVYNEIDQKLRSSVCVLGNVIVSRDGVERMILNSLVHPSVKFLVLFSEESLTFSPCTNLLLAVMNGMEDGGEQYVNGGIAASSHYPNINSGILNKFTENIVVLPLHMHKHKDSTKVVEDYLVWLQDRGLVSEKLIEIMAKANKKGKVYYDVLNSFLHELSQQEAQPKAQVELDPKDFQHLQPPKVELGSESKLTEVPFEVAAENGKVSIKLEIGNEVYGLTGGGTDWDTIVSLAEGLLKDVTEKEEIALTPKEQLLLGAEIGRAHTDVANNTTTPSLVISQPGLEVTKEIDLIAPGDLDVDDEYYYKVGLKGNQISIMAMALDVCKLVYDFRSTNGMAIIDKLAELNRFKKYKYDILHRLDVGTQLARSHIALKNDFMFIQDFQSIFKVNKEKLPFILVDSETFLDVHIKLIKRLYTEGLEEEHADARKGMARTGICLAIYRNSAKALEKMTKIYQQGDTTTDVVREKYAKQLLRKDHDGGYSYGQRTRSHFGVDQLEIAKKALRKDPSKAVLVSRFDPSKDMSYSVNPQTGLKEFTHDPCLTNDIYFVRNGRLNSLHIARAHNTVNAYPENVFGLHDAYVTPIREELGLESGDLYMLSNRANILMLTEDQRTKSLMREPTKPNTHEETTESGPILLSGKKIAEERSVNYKIIEKISAGKKNHYIEKLEDYDGVNIIKKATNYLNIKGLSHNNPVLQTYSPGKDDPQSDQLAFFQANVFAEKVYSTAVFTNCVNQEDAEEAANYIAMQFSKDLEREHGEIYVFFV